MGQRPFLDTRFSDHLRELELRRKSDSIPPSIAFKVPPTGPSTQGRPPPPPPPSLHLSTSLSSSLTFSVTQPFPSLYLPSFCFLVFALFPFCSTTYHRLVFYPSKMELRHSTSLSGLRRRRRRGGLRPTMSSKQYVDKRLQGLDHAATTRHLGFVFRCCCFTFSLWRRWTFKMRPAGLPQPVMTQASVYSNAVFLSSCFHPELIFDHL